MNPVYKWLLGIGSTAVAGVIVALLLSVLDAVKANSEGLVENKLAIQALTLASEGEEKRAEQVKELLRQVNSYEVITYNNWADIRFLFKHFNLTDHSPPASPQGGQQGRAADYSLRAGLAHGPSCAAGAFLPLDATISAVGY